AQADLGRLPALIESLLFAAGAPVPLARLVEALDGPERREVTAALKVLAEDYEREGRGIRLVQVGGGYQLRTPAEHALWVRRLLVVDAGGVGPPAPAAADREPAGEAG